MRLSAPEPLSPDATAANPETPRSPAQLYPPQSPEPPAAAPLRMPAANEPGDTSAAPLDIPQFAVAKPKVANGQHPFPDGFAWLKDHGYRAVLHVHLPGDDETDARKEVEKLGLRYLSLVVSPATLSRDVLDRFKNLVADQANLPLFVYDKDGSLTGGLWYLYYRLVDGLSDDKARAEVARLGFKEDQDDEHRTMWLAIQNLLKNQSP